MITGVRRWRLVAVAAALVPSGCSGDTNGAGFAPTPVRATSYVLSGRVTEPVGVPVAEAVVTVVSGVGEGSAARTNTLGEYVLPGVIGSVTLSFSAEGFATTQKEMAVEKPDFLNVELTPLVAPSNITGTWEVTFEASPACNGLPSSVRARRYDATITQQEQGAAFVVEFSGSEVSGQTTYNGKVRADRVTLSIWDWDYGGMVEKIADGRYLMLSGEIAATATNGAITGTFDGGLYLGDQATPPFAAEQCEAADHRVTFRRR